MKPKQNIVLYLEIHWPPLRQAWRPCLWHRHSGASSLPKKNGKYNKGRHNFLFYYYCKLFNKEETLPSPQSATPSQYLDMAIQSPLRQDHCPPLHPWLQDSSSSPAIFEVSIKKLQCIEMFTTGFDEKRGLNFYQFMNQSEQVSFFTYYCRPGCWDFFSSKQSDWFKKNHGIMKFRLSWKHLLNIS